MALIAIGAFASLAAAPAAARSDGPALAMADAYLTVFDRGDSAAYAAFVQDHWPSFSPKNDEFAGVEDRSRDQSGGYVPVKAVSAGNLSVTEIVKSHLADDYFRLQVKVGADAGHLIQTLTLTPIPRPADVPAPARIADAGVIRFVDRNIQDMGDFSGAVLIARDGRVVYARAGGLADRDHGVANTLDTRFRMASMGKMFTAVAVMQLVQAGKIDLNATVGVYLKDYPNAEVARTVTIAQLLTHTGGTGDFMSQTWADNIARLNTPADYIAMFGTRPPAFRAGSKFDYSNFGYVILGRIVEVVSGQSYEDYVRTRIFRPSGMTHSGLNTPPDAASPLATRYVKTRTGFEPPPAPFSGAATPAGAAYSSVGDMLAFANALDGHRLLDKAHTDLMITPRVQGDDSPDGYGFQIRSVPGVHDVGHDGGGPGENSGFRILNDGEVVVVVLSNVAPTWRADKLCEFIASRMRVGAAR